jgi:hypothetical protein
MKRLIAALIILSLLLAVPALAGGGPENAVVIVNADNADSVTVAQQYVALRQIPPCHVISLSGVPAEPKITVQQFREVILGPVLKAITERGLAAQTDYVIYSCGFPYAVEVSADMAGQKLPRVITQPASLTGLTYLYEPVMAANIGYLALDSNWYCRPVKRQGPPLVLTEDERALRAKLDSLLQEVKQAQRQAAEAKTPPPADVTRWLDEAATILQALVTNHHAPELLYDLACVLGLQGQAEEAMTALQAAYDAGWWNASLTERDTDLTILRGRDDFKALVEKMRAVVVEAEPPLPFHHRTMWSAAGQPAAQGRRYVIAAMLGYIGEKANTLAEVQECLTRARAADGTCPAGTIYFMESTDWARTGPRQWAFRSAAEALRKLGVGAEVLPGVLPQGKADVAGAVIGAATLKWADANSRIVPGAFCDHLTSFAGVMTGTGQTVLSEHIRAGAAGSCGTVTEPYNTPVKFPTAFLHVFYAAGCSLGEAFYQSVRAPYQQLLVGDPLCQPWARAPQVQVAGLKEGETVGKSRWLTPACTRGAGVSPAARFELYVDGVLTDSCVPGKQLRLNVEGLDAGPHEARVVAVVGSLDTTGRAIIGFRVAGK